MHFEYKTIFFFLIKYLLLNLKDDNKTKHNTIAKYS